MCSDQSSWWFQRYPQARVELILDLLPTPRYQCILPSRYHATHKLRHVRTRVYLGSHQAHQPLREPASRASVEDNFFFFFDSGTAPDKGKKPSTRKNIYKTNIFLTRPTKLNFVKHPPPSWYRKKKIIFGKKNLA